MRPIPAHITFISGWRKPVKSHTRVEMKRGSRHTLNAIRSTLRNNKYRKDLKMVGACTITSILLIPPSLMSLSHLGTYGLHLDYQYSE